MVGFAWDEVEFSVMRQYQKFYPTEYIIVFRT
jgi:hypothetical protein